MPDKIKIVNEQGNIEYWNLCRVMFLFLVGALVLIAAQSVNELIEAIIATYIPKKNIWAYLLYAIISISLVLIVVFAACKFTPDLVEYMNLSPV